MPGSFFDTNILIHLLSSDQARAAHAENLIRSGGTISVQVLNESANVCRRKARLSWPDTHAFLTLIRSLLEIVPISVQIHEIGLALAERYTLSLCDAMIAAASLHTGCDTLFSEDMHHGLLLEGRVRIINPFTA